MGAPRPPPFPPSNRLCFLQGFPSLLCPFPTPISCLFPCPFSLFLCLKEECSPFPCALPIPSCLALPWPLSPSSQEWLCLLICPTTSPLPCSCFFWKAPQPNPAPAEVTAPPASSGTPWARAGGAWSPHHTHTQTCSKANLYLPPWLSQWRNVRTHSKAANRAAGGSPPSPAERQELGLSASLHPVPHCREWEHTSGIWPRLVSPLLLQVNSARKTLE